MTSIFDTEEFKPLGARWQIRQQVFATRRSLYDGSYYAKSNIFKSLGWLRPRLYQGVKPFYLPLSRAVDVDTGIVPAGWAFAEDAPESWSEARDLLWSWSKWSTYGLLYVHYCGAKSCRSEG
jgi:hypothetical protein